MFCTNCGSQLPDGTRFCTNCGAPQDAAPVTDTPIPPVEETAPLTQNSLLDAVSEVESIYEAPAAEETPVYEAPAYEAPSFAPSGSVDTPPYIAPKKKKKTGLIIAIVLIAVLLIGGGVGAFLFISNRNANAYDDAMALLEEGKLEEAKAAFEELGSYDDAEEVLENLTSYQNALKLLDEHKYDEAAKAFKDLGKFHDAKTYVESGVDYHMAKYLLECADKADPAALALLDNGTDVDEDSSDLAISFELYAAAGNLFGELGDYLDSAELASESWLGAASVYVDWRDVDAALYLMENLNDEDAAALQALIESSSADSTLLVDLETALVIWLDDEENYSIGEEVQKAYEHLEIYEDLYFVNSGLEKLYHDFMESLETQLQSVDSDGYVEDWVLFYEGAADMYYVCDRLSEQFGFLDGSELEDIFVGFYESAAKYPAIEQSLIDQFYSVEAPWSDEGYYYSPYTNDTGHDFVLHYYVDFYLENELLETSETASITVPAGETVEVPLIPKTLKDDSWNGWTITWWFDVE